MKTVCISYGIWHDWHTNQWDHCEFNKPELDFETMNDRLNSATIRMQGVDKPGYRWHENFSSTCYPAHNIKTKKQTNRFYYGNCKVNNLWHIENKRVGIVRGKLVRRICSAHRDLSKLKIAQSPFPWILNCVISIISIFACVYFTNCDH